MAVEWLAGKRARGTSSERTGLGTPLAFTDTTISKTGVKAYYNFEQTSGSLTNQATTGNGFSDGLGSSADGTNNGATTGSTGKVGSYAWDFDGSNDYVTLGSSTSQFNFMHNTSALWTVFFWLKHTGGSAEVIFSTGDTPYIVDTNGALIVIETSNAIRVVINSGTTTNRVVNYTTTTNYIPDTNWHFYTVSYDQSLSSNNLTITRDNGNTVYGSKTAVTPNNGDHGYIPRIGAVGSSNTTYTLQGSLDELAIFNRVLTSSEVSTLYTEQSSSIPNIQNGTIFEESDTNKAYIWNASTSTWTQL